MQRMGKTRALSLREQEKRLGGRSKTMTPPNIDMEKLCPELDVIIQYYDNPDNKRRAPISMNEVNWRAIAATMLALAEENERLRQGIKKFGDIFVGCYECKKKVQREIRILEEFLAARKGDGDE